MKTLSLIAALFVWFGANAQIKTITDKPTRFRDTPSPIVGKELSILQPGKEIQLIGFKDGYWIAKVDSVKGYISDMFIPETPQNAILRTEYDKAHPPYVENWPTYIKLGMTKRQLIHLIGAPTDVNTSTGAWGIHEQLIYSKEGEKTKYYYIENDILTSIQD